MLQMSEQISCGMLLSVFVRVRMLAKAIFGRVSAARVQSVIAQLLCRIIFLSAYHVPSAYGYVTPAPSDHQCPAATEFGYHCLFLFIKSPSLAFSMLAEDVMSGLVGI